MQRTVEQRHSPKRRTSARRHPPRQDLRLHRAAAAFHHRAGGELDILHRLLPGDEARLALAAGGLGHRRSHRARAQGRGVRPSAGRDRHLHRRGAAAQPQHVCRADAQAELGRRHQQQVHPQHLRAVHRLFRGQCRSCHVLPAGGGTLAASAHDVVRDGAHPVLDRLSPEPVFARLRLRHHLLSDGRGLRLADADHGVRHPHPALSRGRPHPEEARTRRLEG